MKKQIQSLTRSQLSSSLISHLRFQMYSTLHFIRNAFTHVAAVQRMELCRYRSRCFTLNVRMRKKNLVPWLLVPNGASFRDPDFHSQQSQQSDWMVGKTTKKTSCECQLCGRRWHDKDMLKWIISMCWTCKHSSKCSWDRRLMYRKRTAYVNVLIRHCCLTGF